MERVELGIHLWSRRWAERLCSQSYIWSCPPICVYCELRRKVNWIVLVSVKEGEQAEIILLFAKYTPRTVEDGRRHKEQNWVREKERRVSGSETGCYYNYTLDCSSRRSCYLNFLRIRSLRFIGRANSSSQVCCCSYFGLIPDFGFHYTVQFNPSSPSCLTSKWPTHPSSMRSPER